MKRKVIERLLLALLYFEKVFQVYCDMVGVAMGVVLSQEGQPITFFSENLDDAKQKYSVCDKEFYAIV